MPERHDHDSRYIRKPDPALVTLYVAAALLGVVLIGREMKARA